MLLLRDTHESKQVISGRIMRLVSRDSISSARSHPTIPSFTRVSHFTRSRLPTYASSPSILVHDRFGDDSTLPASYGDVGNNHDSLRLVPCRQCWHPPCRAALRRYRYRNRVSRRVRARCPASARHRSRDRGSLLLQRPYRRIPDPSSVSSTVDDTSMQSENG